MKRPQTVSVLKIQDRRSRKVKRPWVVRWTLDGAEKSKSFETRGAADDFSSRIRVAARDGKEFDRITHLPVEWAIKQSLSVAEWVFFWFAREWATLAPRTRKSYVEAIERALPTMVVAGAPAPPSELRKQIRDELAKRDKYEVPKWLLTWAIPLSDLNRQQCSATFNALGKKVDGGSLASSVAGRFRKSTRSILDAAVAAGELEVNPWPTTARGAVQRKAAKSSSPNAAVDIRALPSPASARASIAAVRTHQPGSIDYQVTLWCVYLAGLRPSEARALEIPDVSLPEEGWGTATIRKADQRAGEQWTDEEEETGPTKTATVRHLPICPELVRILRSHIGDRTSGTIVRRSAYSNFSRSFSRACGKVGGKWVPYDLRHLHASLAVSAGCPLPVVAERMGHSLEMLVTKYAHALPGDAERMNALMETRL